MGKKQTKVKYSREYTRLQHRVDLDAFPYFPKRDVLAAAYRSMPEMEEFSGVLFYVTRGKIVGFDITDECVRKARVAQAWGLRVAWINRDRVNPLPHLAGVAAKKERQYEYYAKTLPHKLKIWNQS